MCDVPGPWELRFPSAMALPCLSLGGEGVSGAHLTVPESLGTGLPSAEDRGDLSGAQHQGHYCPSREGYPGGRTARTSEASVGVRIVSSSSAPPPQQGAFCRVRWESNLHPQAGVPADLPLTPVRGPTPSLPSRPCSLDSACPVPAFLYSRDVPHVLPPAPSQALI